MTDTDKATHTPGPWMAGIHADGIEIACQDASAGYMPLAMVYDGLGSEHDGEGDANAALIAQAPTLLAERDDLRAKLAEAEARADAERVARHTREGLYDILQQRGGRGDVILRRDDVTEVRAAGGFSRSPLCECNDREAIHIKGTGPCLRRGCGCHKFREVTHDPDPVRDPVPAGRPEPGRGDRSDAPSVVEGGTR